MAYRYWRDNTVDDLGIIVRLLIGLGYQVGNPDSRVDPVPDPTAPSRLSRTGTWLKTEAATSWRRASVPWRTQLSQPSGPTCGCG